MTDKPGSFVDKQDSVPNPNSALQSVPEHTYASVIHSGMALPDAHDGTIAACKQARGREPPQERCRETAMRPLAGYGVG
jgi:hypothetical protein